ncbi:MAG: class I SAM-dependent methyltransferase [Pseudomonadota bacterium]|nr:class I SAM-dependent methyltransferase [Pseudomonadota bacterium]
MQKEENVHIAEAKGFFDGLANGWSQRYVDDAAMSARSERFLNGLRVFEPIGSTVLDFGCGSGLIAHYLASNGYALTGIDVSTEMISQAQTKCKGTETEFFVYEGSGKFPFDRALFDAVVSSSVLEYIPNPKNVLTECRRVLKKNGTLLVTVPDMRNEFRQREVIRKIVISLPIMRRFLKKTRWREGAEYLKLSCNRFSVEVWAEIISVCGFEVLPIPDEQGPLVMISAKAI